jgi:hypothetical protein
MATVTLIVTLRRTEGRTPPDLDDLADVVATELDAQLEDFEIQVQDSDGNEELTYTVTRVRRARPADVAALETPDDPTPCAHCGAPTTNDPHGRPRLYCSDRCRIYAYRARTR